MSIFKLFLVQYVFTTISLARIRNCILLLYISLSTLECKMSDTKAFIVTTKIQWVLFNENLKNSQCGTTAVISRKWLSNILVVEHINVAKS